MPGFIDLTGERFGRFIVLHRAENRRGRTAWHCRCDCGAEKVVCGADLRSGATKSCGCYHKDHMSSPPVMRGEENPSYSHGCTKTKIYWVWSSMLQRCENKRNKCYERYGGRGISVCDAWHDFAAFKAWADESGYAPGLTIDRIDNNGNYSPDNCRWADCTAQSNNRRCNIKISRDGETHTLAEWAKIKKLPYKVLMARYYRHGDVGELFMEVAR